MRAIVLQTDPSADALRLIDVPEPEPATDSQVLVKVLAVGLDGTDKELLQHRNTVQTTERGNLILGHELLGEVISVPAGSSLQPGDLVTSLVRRPCNDPGCEPCRNGRADFCVTGQFTERGIMSADGFLTEYIVEEERFLVRIPTELADIGLLIEPQSVIEKAMTTVQAIHHRTGHRSRSALILGAGPLGVLAALTCRSLGWETDVYAKEPVDRHGPQLLTQSGCVYHQAGDAGTLAAIGKEWDVVLECTGYSLLAIDSIGVLARNGILMIIGVPATVAPLLLPADEWLRTIMSRNLSMIGTVNSVRCDFEQAIIRLSQMRRQFPTLLERIVTDTCELAQVPELDFGSVSLKAVVRIAQD